VKTQIDALRTWLASLPLETAVNDLLEELDYWKEETRRLKNDLEWVYRSNHELRQLLNTQTEELNELRRQGSRKPDHD
jgi:hypothetical protein